MLRLGAVTAFLLLSQTSAWADDPPAGSGSSGTPWIQRVFSSAPPAAPLTGTPAPRPATVTEVTRSCEQEHKVYLERLAFCTHLRLIAVQTDDNDLARKADELEQLSAQVFTKRTASLESRVKDAKAAEAALDQHNAGPAGTASTNRVVTGHYPNGRPILTQE